MSIPIILVKRRAFYFQVYVIRYLHLGININNILKLYKSLNKQNAYSYIKYS